MFNGAHVLMYSRDADADRRFLQDVLGLPAVDSGGGWLILGLPPAELGVHPGDGTFTQRHGDHELLGCVVYLMCDDLEATLRTLRERGVDHSDVETAEWGDATSIALPSGGRLGLYQPRHPTATHLLGSEAEVGG